MATLYTSMIPPIPFLCSYPLYPFNHRFNIFPSPKFKFRPPTALNHDPEDALAPHLKYPHPHFIPATDIARNGSVSLTSDTESFDFLPLLSNKSLCDCRQVHAQVVKFNALKSNGFVGNKLLITYAKSKGFLDDARKLFNEIPEKTTPAYAALIGAYCRSERWDDLFIMLGMMFEEGRLPDKYLVPTILKACSTKQFLKSGKMVHGYVIRKELGYDIFVGNGLINLYSNCGDLRYSRNVFDSMEERDVVSWTALIVSYMKEGLSEKAVDVFNLMQWNGVEPDLISWNALVAGFAQNGEIDLALDFLEEMQEKRLSPKVNTWNGIISGCVQNGYFEEAMDVFIEMLQFPENPNVITIVSILSACAGFKDLKNGSAVHGYSIKHELCGHSYVDGSLIDMYAKCGKTDYAEQVFGTVVVKNTAMWNEMISAYVNEGKIEDAVGFLNVMVNGGLKPDVITYNTILAGHAKMGKKSEAFSLLSEMILMNLKPTIVSFNVLISGFQQAGLSFEALKLFRSMQALSSDYLPIKTSVKPNSITVNGALAACADLNYQNSGKEIHGYIVRNFSELNIYIAGALVDMYAKCHNMESALKVFLRVDEKNAVLWNVLMTGHINNNCPGEALNLFHGMLGDGLKPSLVTFLILLSGCNYITSLRSGRELHTCIIKTDFHDSTIILASALIDMYAKCGSIVDAKLVFDFESKKDVALWNSMISAYQIHGLASDAITLFKNMEKSRIVPDHITFLGVISACARNGLVEQGWEFFNSMEKMYGITPGLEHYTCMVKILGGAGLLDEALDFIKRMPYPPDACLWATLLQACRTHSNPEIGEKAAKSLFELEPENASNYALLSNIYASSGLWDSANNLRSFMKNKSLMTQIKECSYVNVGTKIYAFKGGESFFAKLEEILKKWDQFASEMELAEYFPHDPVFEDDEELDPFSCLHTEKLAICFGVISSKPGHSIHVSKNIRMCIDCHTSAKLISKIARREIFLKDACFFHHFKNGMCSCQDRW